MKSDRPPRFKPMTAPVAIAVQKVMKAGRFRGNPADRGYDHRWTRLSIVFRKRHPFCRWCEQEGRDTLADLVDHIIPVVDRPELRLEWKNCEVLCTHCHGKKTAMEVYARERGMLDMLPSWCADPAKRPVQFQPVCLPIK